MSLSTSGLTTPQRVRDWIERIGAKTLFIEPGNPWGKEYNESFNGKLRDELLNGEIFHSVKEAEVLIEEWRETYNQIRRHNLSDYGPRYRLSRLFPEDYIPMPSVDLKTCVRH